MPGCKLLLVEGKDDEHVLKHICSNRGITLFDKVESCEGFPRLLARIPVQLIASQKEGDVVGVVVDADTNVSDRWRSIKKHLTDFGYLDVPNQPDPDGTIFQAPQGTTLPRVGIWIMPDNMTSGNLEDFLKFLIPQPHTLFEHVRSCVESIPQKLYKPKDESKVVIHTWLAWQESPGKPYGTAITARFLETNVRQVDILVNWLNLLFHQ